MSKLLEKFIAWRDKPKIWTKKNTIIIVFLICTLSFCIGYTFFTKEGLLVRESFYRCFNNITEVRNVEIYSGGTLVEEYLGYYRVEQYKGYIVLLNEETGERTDIYGASVVVNSPQE